MDYSNNFALFVKEVTKNYKHDLEVIYEYLLKDFVKNNHDLFAKNKIDVSFFYKKKITNPQRYAIYSAIFFYKDIYNAFFNHIPEDLKLTLEKVVWEGRVSLKSIEDIFQKELVSEDESGIRRHIHPILCLFCIDFNSIYDRSVNNFVPKDINCSFPPFISEQIQKIASIPDKANLLPLDVPGNTEFLFVSDKSSVNEFSLFKTYLESIAYPTLNTAFINKLQKKIQIREFYPKEAKALQNLRSSLMAAFYLSCKAAKQEPNPLLYLKLCFEKFQTGHFSYLQYVLPHIRSSAQESTLTINKYFVGILQRLSFDKWVSVENLIDHISYSQKKLLPLKATSGRHSHNYRRNGYQDSQYLREEDYIEIILKPFVKGMMFTMASMGFVDIAYDYPSNTKAKDIQSDLKYISTWDGLKYVKVTQLGSYVIGVHLHPGIFEVPPEVNSIYLDDALLLIHVPNNDPVKNLMLEKYAVRISEKRYKVSYEIFLKGCESKYETEQKIKSFKRDITSELPEIWKQFFNNILENFNKIQEKKHYKIFQLPHSDQRLISLIAKDSDIQEFVLKAEQFHIMIPLDEVDNFKKRLKTFGYILN